MSRLFFNFKILTFVVGLSIGAIFFFPYDHLKFMVIQKISRATGLDLRIQQLKLGTGLGLGVLKGGLIAFKAEGVQVAGPKGGSIECESLVLSPQLWSFLIARLQVTISCKLSEKNKSEVLVVFVLPKFWSQENASAELDLDNVDLSLAESFAPVTGLQGLLSGHLSMDAFSPQKGTLPNLGWSLSAKGLVLPSLTSDFLMLPAVRLDNLESKGTFSPSHIKIEQLNFGNENTPLRGQITADLKLDQGSNPQSGEISGKITSDVAFEKSQLRDIDFNDVFGKANEAGERNFKKSANGSWMFLLKRPLDN